MIFFEKAMANSSAISFICYFVVFRKVIYCMGMKFTSDLFFIMSHTDFVFVAELSLII